MYILAFEAANFSYSIALVYKYGDNNKLYSFEQCNHYQGQSHRLISVIHKMFKNCNITFSELSAIAVTTGPGSFTGVRLALAAATGFKIATNVPVVGIDSFNLCANVAASDNTLKNNILVVLESRRHDQYCQLWSYDLKAIKKPMNIDPNEIQNYCNYQPVHLIGNGVKNIESELNTISYTCAKKPMFDARDLADLFFLQKLTDTSLTPFYLRSPDIHHTI